MKGTDVTGGGSRPPLRSLLREARWMTEWMAGMLASDPDDLPRGDGHGVLLLPGFLAPDRSMSLLGRVLRRLGYRTYRSGLGINAGPTRASIEWLRERVPDVIARSGGPISIVGQSLGGIYAREIARQARYDVRTVITLGSPFRDPENTNASGLASRLRSRWDEEHRYRPRLATPLPIPSTAIYSKSDGIVPWQACLEEPGLRRENIEVGTSHIGMSVHPSVIRIVADRLAQPPGEWRPYEATRQPPVGASASSSNGNGRRKAAGRSGHA